MKKAIITACCLITAGILVCIGALALINFDFRKLDNTVYITNTYEFTENINNIAFNCSTADIEVTASDDSTAKVVCFEREKKTHTVSLTDGTLRINEKSDKWYKNINLGFSFRSPKITICLPQKEYNSFIIDCTTGDVTINNLSLDSLSIDVSTGDITINNSTINSVDTKTTTGDTYFNSLNNINTLKAKATTGEIELNNVTSGSTDLNASTGHITLINSVTENHTNIKTTTGSIKFENYDSATMNCKTTTGGIKGSLLTNKIFYTDTSTGRVDVPKSTEGGLCELKTTTGNIRITVISR